MKIFGNAFPTHTKTEATDCLLPVMVDRVGMNIRKLSGVQNIKVLMFPSRKMEMFIFMLIFKIGKYICLKAKC